MNKVEQKDIELIRPFANNPRFTNGVDALAKVIQEYGFTNPILVNKDNEIIAGHTRYLAAKKLGFKKIPCIELSHLSERQQRQYRLIDNKVAEFSHYTDGFEHPTSDDGVFGEIFSIDNNKGDDFIYDSTRDDSLEDDTHIKTAEHICPYCYHSF